MIVLKKTQLALSIDFFIKSGLSWENRDTWQACTDMRQGYLLNLTYDMGLNKQQRHAILLLALLKIDRRHEELLSEPHMSQLDPATPS